MMRLNMILDLILAKDNQRLTGKFRVLKDGIYFMVKGARGLEEETAYKDEREDKTSGALILTRDYPGSGKDIYVLQSTGAKGVPTPQ